MAEKSIRTGVIGVGYLGKFHAEKYAAMNNVTLIGVADNDDETATQVASRCGTRKYTNYKEMLADVEAVSIVVPTSLHFDVARDCLAAGKDIIVEKPFTTTLDEADELIKMADERRLVLQVGHLERYNPAVLAMEQQITSPVFIESHRIHTFKNRGTDVDVVLDLMIHDIDIILNIVKSPIKMIHAVGVPVVTRTTDIANARVIFENGCTANVTVSRISKDNIRKLRIFEPRAFISVDYAKKEIFVIRQRDDLDEHGLPAEEVLHSCFIEQDALENELKDFVGNVRKRKTPKVSGREGRLALKVAMEIMAQIKDHAGKYGAGLGL